MRKALHTVIEGLSDTHATVPTRFEGLRNATQRAEAERSHCLLLSQLAMLLEHLATVYTIDRMEFAYLFRLAVTGLTVWEDMEGLIYTYCEKFPVSLFSHNF